MCWHYPEGCQHAPPFRRTAGCRHGDGGCGTAGYRAVVALAAPVLRSAFVGAEAVAANGQGENRLVDRNSVYTTRKSLLFKVSLFVDGIVVEPFIKDFLYEPHLILLRGAWQLPEVKSEQDLLEPPGLVPSYEVYAH
jgi:hypothetical protein